MDSTPLTKPQMASQANAIPNPEHQQYQQQEPSSNDGSTSPSEPQPRPRSEFDPFSNAKVTSPFYLYKHDSPRPSYDGKPRTPTTHPIHVSIKDLEASDVEAGLTPTITQEKSNINARCKNTDSGKLRLWGGRKRCLTKPQQKKWLSGLPHWQRLTIKLVIALLILGAMVGIAIGISVKVHGGVYKSSNQTTNIGS